MGRQSTSAANARWCAVILTGRIIQSVVMLPEHSSSTRHPPSQPRPRARTGLADVNTVATSRAYIVLSVESRKVAALLMMI